MLVRIFLSLLCLFLSNESFSLENVKQEPKKELIFELLDPNALYPAFGAVPLCNGKIRLTNKLGAEIKKLEISFVFKGVAIPYTFTSVSDQAVVVRSLGMVGKGCTGLFEKPDLKIKTCEVEGTDVICDQYVRFYLDKKGQEK